MRRGAPRLAAAFLLGAASVLGFAPFYLFPVPLITLALLAWLWQGAAPRTAAMQGFAFGAGCFLAGVSWVYVSMHVFGGMPPLLAGLAAFLFCCLLAMFPALAGFSFARLRSGRLWADALLFASVWTLTEWLRSWVLTGFPWLSFGYAQTPPSPLAGYAALLGVYGVGFAAAMVAGTATAGDVTNVRIHNAKIYPLVFLQETKCDADQVPKELHKPEGWGGSAFHSGEKKGMPFQISTSASRRP